MGNCLGPDQNRQRSINYMSGQTENIGRNGQSASKNVGNGLPRTNPMQLQYFKPNLNPIFPKSIVSPTSNPTLGNKIVPIPGETFQIKVPKDFNTWTEFQWFKQPKYGIPREILQLDVNFMKNRSFQQKYGWFRGHLQKRRIPWNSGKSDYLEVDRNNLLMSSNAQFQKINFYKEVKIVFKEQNETSDAGGLIREWMNLCIKQIFNPELNLLKLCDTQGTFYKLHYNENVTQLFQVAAKILGVVIGKAIFERIPLKCFLNYTILRQLCSQPIQINDIYTYDKDFYSGWQYMIKNNMVTALEQNFCVYEFDEHGTQITMPLKENGYEIMVNSTNKEQYISLMTEYYCTKSVEKLLMNLKFGLYSIIPKELLSIFEPHELDIIISGKQEINVDDLRTNTVYTGYKPSDPLIVKFWQYIKGLNNKKLENMLHFVTGTGRVPMLGFKYLESNRGEYKPFHIMQVPFEPTNPYPKSHTCFNRLQLPAYPSDDLFYANIEYITCEIEYFGLE